VVLSVVVFGGRAGGLSWASTVSPSGQGSPSTRASREERNEEKGLPVYFLMNDSDRAMHIYLAGEFVTVDLATEGLDQILPYQPDQSICAVYFLCWTVGIKFHLFNSQPSITDPSVRVSYRFISNEDLIRTLGL
jgi:hypothetical protein